MAGIVVRWQWQHLDWCAENPSRGCLQWTCLRHDRQQKWITSGVALGEITQLDSGWESLAELTEEEFCPIGKNLRLLRLKEIGRFFGNINAVNYTLIMWPFLLRPGFLGGELNLSSWIQTVVNSSLSVGVDPLSLKEGVICLLLNKPSLHQPALSLTCPQFSSWERL